jgi:hypothetical protein
MRRRLYKENVLPFNNFAYFESDNPRRKDLSYKKDDQNEGNLEGKISAMIHHLPHQTLDLRHLLDSSRYDLLALFGAIL